MKFRVCFDFENVSLEALRFFVKLSVRKTIQMFCETNTFKAMRENCREIMTQRCDWSKSDLTLIF